MYIYMYIYIYAMYQDIYVYIVTSSAAFSKVDLFVFKFSLLYRLRHLRRAIGFARLYPGLKLQKVLYNTL